MRAVMIALCFVSARSLQLVHGTATCHQRAAPLSPAAQYAWGRSPPVRLSEEPPPQEVIDAEDKATPNRKYRIATAAVGVGVSVVSGGFAVATLSNQGDFGDVLLFGSPLLTLAADVIIGGTSAWAWQQEERTKSENIARIWAEVKRRRSGGAASGANRSQRRAKKVAVPGGAMPGAGGFGQSPPAAAAARKSAAPQRTGGTDAKPAASGDGGGGLLTGMTSLLEEANAMGKANAVSLNAKLEDAGVLPPLAPKSSSGSAVPEAPPLASSAADPTPSPDEPAATTAAAADGTRTSASSRARTKGGKGGKGGKKKRRR